MFFLRYLLVGLCLAFVCRQLPTTEDPACCGRVALQGGSFMMGTLQPVYSGDGEAARFAWVGPFSIDRCAVTNAAFASFVEAKAYVTDAEQFGWSYVWHYLYQGNDSDIEGRPAAAPWWLGVRGASWRLPHGPGGDNYRDDHPVVHVSWKDASRYCRWKGGRLPTEAEWEWAARGGLSGPTFPWGNDSLTPQHANTYQGSFPDAPVAEDGYLGTAPVCSFSSNGYGLHNMVGNVWEWVHDSGSNKEERLTKGGSFMCHSSYCQRYRIAARHAQTADTSSMHIGFRCAYD